MLCDAFCQISLIDPARPTADNSLTLIVFAAKDSALPRCTHVGDILRAHRVQLKRRRDSYSIVGMYVVRVGMRFLAAAAAHAQTLPLVCLLVQQEQVAVLSGAP